MKKPGTLEKASLYKKPRGPWLPAAKTMETSVSKEKKYIIFFELESFTKIRLKNASIGRRKLIKIRVGFPKYSIAYGCSGLATLKSEYQEGIPWSLKIFNKDVF